MTIHEPPTVRRGFLPFDLRDDSEVRRRSEAAKRLLVEWDADDSGYDETVWPHLKEAPDHERRRIAARLLFGRE